jgi:hypothetical protein
MSHIVTIQTKVTDTVALAAACRRLQLPEPSLGVACLYSGYIKGMVVRLKGWNYPVVADMATGELRYDNFGGAWGNEAQVGQLLQAYAVEKARIEARRAGYRITEQTLNDGSIKLTVQVGSGGAP